MDETANVTALPEPALPDVVRISGTGDLRMSPNEMDELKRATGRTLTALLSDEEHDSDRYRVMVWIRLRRDGFTPRWEDVGRVEIEFGEEPEPDPTNATG